MDNLKLAKFALSKSMARQKPSRKVRWLQMRLRLAWSHI